MSGVGVARFCVVLVLLVSLGLAGCDQFLKEGQSSKAAATAVEDTSRDKLAVDTDVPTQLKGNALRYPGMPDFPAVGMILKLDSNEKRFKQDCTGTLVAPNVVLTAGHCICTGELRYNTYDKCGIGKSYASEDVKPAHLQPSGYRVFFQHGGVFKVKSLDVFPNYNVTSIPRSGDLGVMVLERDVENIKPAALVQAGSPPKAEDQDGNAVIVGFGKHPFSSNEEFGIKLHAVTIVKKTNAQCPNGVICAQPREIKKINGGTICSGDSGGPLFVFDPGKPAKDQGFPVWGVNHAVSGCQISNQGYHMDLAFLDHQQWVRDKLQSLSSAFSTSASSEVASAKPKQLLNAVFNDDTVYSMSRGSKLSGVFERGFALLPDDGSGTGKVEQSFNVSFDAPWVRLSLNAHVYPNEVPAMGELMMEIRKVDPGGVPFAPRTLCNEEVKIDDVVRCRPATPLDAILPVVISDPIKLQPGTYTVAVFGDPGRVVQFVATSYTH